MDDRDWAIIKLLKENSRLSNSEIGRILNVSEGTVRKRIAHLISNGAIRKFTITTGLEGIDGIVLIKAETKKAQELVKRIKAKYDDIYEFSGRVDLAIRVSCSNIEELNRIVDEIREIEGVKSTDTLVRLS